MSSCHPSLTSWLMLIFLHLSLMCSIPVDISLVFLLFWASIIDHYHLSTSNIVVVPLLSVIDTTGRIPMLQVGGFSLWFSIVAYLASPSNMVFSMLDVNQNYSGKKDNTVKVLLSFPFLYPSRVVTCFSNTFVRTLVK